MITLQEFSRKGGKATASKYGRKHFVDIGKKGLESQIAKYGAEGLKEFYRRRSLLSAAARKKNRQLRQGKKPESLLQKAAKLITGG